MNKSSSSKAGKSANRGSFLVLLALLVIVLSALFYESFQPGKVLFSNDGPYGSSMSKSSLPSFSLFSGNWQDLNWLGNEGPTAIPHFSTLIDFILGPMGYAKFAALIAQLVLGLSAWFFFRQLRLTPVACLAGGVAAALNSDFFSTSCWGLSVQAVCAASNYLALAALAGATATTPFRSWARFILAGLAVGLGVMEGADVGAEFSLFVAAFVLFQTLFLGEKEKGTAHKAGLGIARLVVVAAFAGLIATNVIFSLVGTQVKGIAGMAQDPQTRAANWTKDTTWSLPPNEMLQVAVPGVYGYRNEWYMYENADPTYDQYWGLIGEDGHGQWRLSGTGLYAGVFVVLVSLWGIFRSFGSKNLPFSKLQRRALWFWTGVLVATMLLAFGKYLPFFYGLFYALPYAPTIRNPTKFMHIFSWALPIVFAYGMHGLYVAYMQNPVARVGGVMAQFKNWRARAIGFDRKWLTGCVILIACSLFFWLFYAAGTSKLEAYLKTVGIAPDQAAGVAQFAVHAVGWFILILMLATSLLALIFSGQFSGPRAKMGGLIIALFLCADLGRADRPWVAYWDTNYKYAHDQVVSFLADKSYEHRVTVVPLAWVQAFADKKIIQFNQTQGEQFNHLFNAYQGDWKQHLFWYNDIQCVDVAQEPRIPQDKIDFMSALGGNPAGTLRLWELSNTRYLLGFGGAFVDLLNQYIDPVEKRFRIATLPDGHPATFNFVLKDGATKSSAPSPWPEDYTTKFDPKGLLAVIEFTGALPRASLYADWQVDTNYTDVLHTLAAPDFNARQKVIVADPIPAPPEGNTSLNPGTVAITHYEPRHVEMEADVKTPAVLLWCDRYNPDWTATVDGKPAQLLRCNSVERGVYLDPKQIGVGKHVLAFQFAGSLKTVGVSFAAIFIGLLLCGWLAVTREPDTGESTGPDGNDHSRKPATPPVSTTAEPKAAQEAQSRKARRK